MSREPTTSAGAILRTLQAVLDRRQTLEMCGHCGAVSPGGTHETKDIDGTMVPTCQGADRLHEMLWHTRLWWCQWPPADEKKLARSYGVRS